MKILRVISLGEVRKPSGGQVCCGVMAPPQDVEIYIPKGVFLSTAWEIGDLNKLVQVVDPEDDLFQYFCLPSGFYTVGVVYEYWWKEEFNADSELVHMLKLADEQGEEFSICLQRDSWQINWNKIAVSKRRREVDYV